MIAEVAALSARRTSSRERWLGALTSVAAFVFGIAMLANPASSFATAIDLLGLFLVVIGALHVLEAADGWYRRRKP